MPIYEFECGKCNNVFEILCVNRNTFQINSPCCNVISKKIISAVNFKVDKLAYKPLKSSKPRSYVPTLHDLGLDKESKKKRKKGK